ncbi:ArsC family reductase [Ketobacter sp. MCCC 1A13808]|uniref:ArsC family reductase n=1 Tax=Ketobacter sp. MCCC 1A13808 TaxID=2602738 RepID=UPI000F23708B|nr:ArsC family reductase [Ketobacter sp. MCCC 1A13808]MVF12725.1 ArsC family reductase [Ketobacter sp. MCCC 1A13808]RLP53987.1 MAG: ArsC family reductase [Ketobacter sp.]
MSTTLYGIPNCDSVKKARKWLDANGVEFEFHDFRKDGLSEATMEQWLQQQSWEVLLNKRGTTWRQLPEDVKHNTDASNAKKLMLENLTLIKRPVVIHDQSILVGFKEASFQSLFNK